jgi:galactonate dehydratase
MNSITKIETFMVPPRWMFVRVETRDGVVGWGEASLEGHCEAVEGEFAVFRDRFIGADPDRIEEIWQIAYRLGFYRGGPVMMSAISGLDQALWDIKGKSLGVPVHQLLGGRVRDRVPVYAWIGGDDPKDEIEAAQARIAQGFRAVKMNGTGKIGWLDSPHLLDDVVRRVGGVREMGLDVAIDFHGRLHRPMAKQLVAELQPLKPLFVEEPLLSEHSEAIRTLAEGTSVPIALGERLYSRWDFKPFFESSAIDIAQPDLSHAGGISECRRIATAAEAYDIPIAPHSPLGPIALAACVQLALATPNFALQEMSLGMHYNSAEHDLLTYLQEPEIFAISDGMIDALTGPGLGIEINEELVRKVASEQPHRWRTVVWRGADGAVLEW